MTRECIEALIRAALSVRERAYAPYSHFAVGAAVMAEDGAVFMGCNVENASYGATLCAERNALAAAVAAGHQTFRGIAIAGSPHGCTTPCGICRQVLLEFHVPLIICAQDEHRYILLKEEELLPAPFSNNQMTSGEI